MGDEWKNFLDGYIQSYPNSYWALALGYADSENLGTLFAATDVDNSDDCWAAFYAEPYETELGGEKVTMDETAHIAKVLNAVGASKPPPMTLFLGTNKYQITQTDVEDINGEKYITVMLAASGKGGAIVQGPTYFAIGLFEEKREQTKGSCRNDVFKLCEAANSA